MSNQSRKKFIKQIALTGIALLMNQVRIFGGDRYRLSEKSNDNVVYYEKNSSEYENLRKGFNKRIDKFPRVIALCKNENGVAEALNYAKANSLEIAIKSGGHCMEGLSSNDNGMVINLSLLDKIEWIDESTIAVGPACTLKKIYETLLPRRKYLPGGSCQSVAIGGLTLGGGYGLLSRRFGLTCDSLLEATMVTPAGKIVNTADDPELLWALKGGGNGNFGIVTQMKFKISNAPAVMRSYKFKRKNVDTQTAKEECKEWFAFSKTLHDACFSAFIFNGKTTYILLTNAGVENAPVKNFIKYFKERSSYFYQGKRLQLAHALKAYYAEANPITFKNASAGLYKDFDEIEPVIGDVFELVKSRPGILYQVNTLGGKIQSAAFMESSSFAHRDCYYFSELQAYWETAAATNKFFSHFQLIQQKFYDAGVRSQYRNYPDINFIDWAQQYYGKNLARLLAVKKKYDPANILNGMQTLTV